MKRTADRQELCNRLTELLKMTGTASDLESLEYEAPGLVVARYTEGEALIDTWCASDKDFLVSIIEQVA